ncbi:hypothetical protein F5879DRAFT_950142 [Lentinula edodes]|nr:hypothetical protein F5879DRAFT_950142 [Lentinula edodes]
MSKAADLTINANSFILGALEISYRYLHKNKNPASVSRKFVSLLTFLNVINFSVAFVPWAPIPIIGARSKSRAPDSMTNAERLIRELPPRAPKGLFNRLSKWSPFAFMLFEVQALCFNTPTTWAQPVCKRGNGNGNGGIAMEAED